MTNHLGNVNSVSAVDFYNTGVHQLVMACSSSAVDNKGSLKVCTKGFQLRSLIEGPHMYGAPKLLCLKEKLDDQYDSYLLFSYGAAKKTQILTMKSEDFEPADIKGFEENEATLAGNDTFFHHSLFQ